MINVELFSCAGGMAAGFRRAGIEFDLAIDYERNHCDSYERNLGHRPEQLDVRGLLAVLRRIRRGERVVDGPYARTAARLLGGLDLLVADPPCTPWSRAGLRMGRDDERDMLVVTCSLIAILRPRRYLIGNVPGLEDGVNLRIVHRTIGALAQRGYCVADFLSLDAADYSVPQHRKRPFWFGHVTGPCLRPPPPTHCDPLDLHTLPLPGITPLQPWVTCREALGHLAPDELGRAVKMRRRAQNGVQLGSVPDRPARVVGTSNLSDGNVISMPSARPLVLATRHDKPVHTSELDAPARTVTTQCRAPGHATTIVLNDRHAPNTLDAPSQTILAKIRGNSGQMLSLAEPTLGAKYRGQGAQVLNYDPRHQPSFGDEPAMTVRAGSGQGATRAVQITGRKKRPPSTKGPQSTRTISPDRPSTTVHAREDRLGSGSPVLDWPWQRPATTIQRDDRIAPPGHHDESFAIMSLPDAVILSERAAAILQGFPDDGSWTFCGATKKARWGAIGMAMPPALAEAVARSIVEQDRACADQPENANEAHGERACLCEVTPCPCRCHPDGGIAEAG